MRPRGRPKKPWNEHLGCDEITYEECAALLRQIYDEFGSQSALSLIQKFDVIKLQYMDKVHYRDFIRIGQSMLGRQRTP